jgi:hypothetical protein
MNNAHQQGDQMLITLSFDPFVAGRIQTAADKAGMSVTQAIYQLIGLALDEVEPVPAESLWALPGHTNGGLPHSTRSEPGEHPRLQASGFGFGKTLHPQPGGTGGGPPRGPGIAGAMSLMNEADGTASIWAACRIGEPVGKAKAGTPVPKYVT